VTPEPVINYPLRRKLAAGDLLLGLTVRQLRTADAALIARACGFDILIIDREHSRIDGDAVSAICIAASALGVAPFVRVASPESRHIADALDGGALGIIVPHVDSRPQAEAAVRHAKFPPLGTRSFAALGPASGYRAMAMPELMHARNDAIFIIAMLETAQGIAASEAIAAVAGIDALLIGPNDLSAEMGIPGELAHPRIGAAYQTVATACAAHGKIFAAGGVPGLDMPELIKMGARLLMGGTDVGYLMAAAQRDAADLRRAGERSDPQKATDR
jgi:2-keto-3-deoxy-L-rhamnonate aldolase RhmA